MILGASGPTIGEMQPNTSYVVLYCTNGTTTTYCLLPTSANQYLTFDVNGTPQCSPMPSNGATGATGPQGAKGDTGSTGTQGIKGDTGAQGSAGTTGATGGIGLTGASGAQGAQGSTGSAGASGASGSAATIAVGSVSTGAAGSSAAVTNSGTSSTAVFNFTIPQGLVGATGSTGLTGAQGATGNTGSQGASGAAGTAATIAVGTVAAGASGSAPTITNSGTTSAAVFNFTLPVSSPSFSNAVSRSISTTNNSANGFQVSPTRSSHVAYPVTITSTSTIGGPSSGTIVLEVCATNSATGSDWTTIDTFTNTQTITLAVVLQSIQAITQTLQGFVPSGWFSRIRSLTATGTITYSTSTTGQEVLL